MRILLVAILTFYITFSHSQSYVIYNGGEKQIFQSLELIQEKFEKPYLRTDKENVIRVEQVEAYQNEEGYFTKNELTKTKTDFAKRVIHGRVSVFEYDLSGSYIQNGQSNERMYYAYQKYDEPIKQMIYKNLSKDLNDNSSSMKKLNKVKLAQKIAPVYYTLGGASLLTSIILFNSESSDLATPFFLGGIAFISIPWILNSKRQKRMDQAVMLYNAD